MDKSRHTAVLDPATVIKKPLKRQRSLSPASAPHAVDVNESFPSSSKQTSYIPSTTAIKRVRRHSSASTHLTVPYQEEAAAACSYTPAFLPSPPLPLTKANLRKLAQTQGSMASQVASTKKSTASSSTATKQTWAVLRRNNIFDSMDERGEQLGVDIVNDATAIIEAFRKSSMAQEEQLQVKKAIRYNYHSNETTFLVELWKVLLNESRDRKVQDTDPKTEEEWLTQSWMKDGLRALWQTHFDPKAVPQLDSDDDQWIKETAPPKVKTPHPDITYGCDTLSYNLITRDCADAFGTSLCEGLCLFPWFIVEAKSYNESIDDADAQCARGGATIVSQDRKFNDCVTAKLMECASSAALAATDNASATVPHHPVGTSPCRPLNAAQAEPAVSPGYPHVDRLNIAFSLSVHPSKANLHVHFAVKETATSTHYHMQYLDSYDFRKLDNYPRLHQHINNILDWGLGERKQRMELLCAKYHEAVRMTDKKRKAD